MRNPEEKRQKLDKTCYSNLYHPPIYFFKKNHILLQEGEERKISYYSLKTVSQDGTTNFIYLHINVHPITKGKAGDCAHLFSCRLLQ